MSDDVIENAINELTSYLLQLNLSKEEIQLLCNAFAAVLKGD